MRQQNVNKAVSEIRPKRVSSSGKITDGIADSGIGFGTPTPSIAAVGRTNGPKSIIGHGICSNGIITSSIREEKF